MKREIRLIAISMVLFLAHQVMESFLVARFAPNGYSDLCQLDCGGYTSLSQFDYSNIANFAYFPLFPLASSFVAHLLDLAPQTGVIITSKMFFLFSIYAFIKLAQSIAPSTHALVNGSIAAFNPYSIYGNAGYTEPLFLFLTCIFFTLMERRSFLKAGLAGAFLSATRLVGVVSVVSYLISLIQPWPTWRWGDRIKVLAGMALIPTGLLIFMAYLQERTGDPLTFIHVQRAFGRATPVGPTSWIFNLSKGLSSD